MIRPEWYGRVVNSHHFVPDLDAYIDFIAGC